MDIYAYSKGNSPNYTGFIQKNGTEPLSAGIS